MNPQQIIDDARSAGSRALSEFDSKQLLEAYGVPITREILAQNWEQAVSAAEKMPGKVALKACFAAVDAQKRRRLDRPWPANKRRGGRGLRTSEGQGRATGHRIAGHPGPGDDLRQPGVGAGPQPGLPIRSLCNGGHGRRIRRGSFRTPPSEWPPLDQFEAEEMIGGSQMRQDAGIVSGDQGPVDMQSLCRAIQGVAAIGLEHPEIAEIDVNPLIIEPGGAIKAVDGLVVLGEIDHETVARQPAVPFDFAPQPGLFRGLQQNDEHGEHDPDQGHADRLPR